jgi:hypothetical protein
LGRQAENFNDGLLASERRPYANHVRGMPQTARAANAGQYFVVAHVFDDAF